jgi:hypothetical protein
MRDRHLLDILKDSTSWTAFTRHFGPPSGADPKVARALQRYILTVFGYGCNLGPVQTARHAVGIASADTLRRLSGAIPGSRINIRVSLNNSRGVPHSLRGRRPNYTRAPE